MLRKAILCFFDDDEILGTALGAYGNDHETTGFELCQKLCSATVYSGEHI